MRCLVKLALFPVLLWVVAICMIIWTVLDWAILNKPFCAAWRANWQILKVPV